MSFLLLVLLGIYNLNAQTYSSYLWAYFTGNSGSSQQALRYAISDNGYEFSALNGGEPVLSSTTIAATGGIRDPHILRGEDGTFYMTMTDMRAEDGWDSNHAIIMLKSTNLIDWTYSRVDMHTAYPQQFGSVNHFWAPQTIYDRDRKQYMVYFSMRSGSADNSIYYSYANADFTALETVPRVLYSRSGGAIDADINLINGTYRMFWKHEEGMGIKQATATTLTGPYTVSNDSYLQIPSSQDAEGPILFQIIDENLWILTYDMYNQKTHPFSETRDFRTFALTSKRTTRDFAPRHGSIIHITAEERAALVAKWGL